MPPPNTPTIFAQPGTNDNPHANLVESLMRKAAYHAADTPRSRQTQLGLSEFGDKCDLMIAWKLAGRERINNQGDAWASTLGTWGHAGITETIRNMPDADDWLLDFKVTLAGIIPGSLDAYHIPTGTIIDFKFCGPDTIKRYRREGPPPKYVVQAHGYGTALADHGVNVQHVALAFLPRSHNLTELWIWTQPLDRTIAEQALNRVETILDLLDALHLWENPESADFQNFPRTPSRSCTWCPFWKPGSVDITQGCNGKTPT